MSYSSVDQRKFFKRPEKEKIREVLAALESTKEGTKWPFQIDDSCPWVAANQPQTHVQVINIIDFLFPHSNVRMKSFLQSVFFLR